MKLKLLITLIIAIVGSFIPMNAQIEKAMQSYDFSRALEELRKDNNSDALDFLNKEIANNPKNAYAHFFIACLEAQKGNYNEAMDAINKAIKNFPKKDKDYIASAYQTRADLYATVCDTVRSLADYEIALKLNPSDVDILETHAQLLYELERYSEADADYNKIIDLQPASVMGYMGLGRNAYAQGNYNEAIAQYNKVIGIYDDYSAGYSYRAECYLKMGKYLDAANDIMTSLSIDGDSKAYHYLYKFPKEQFPLVYTKLKAMAAKEPHNVMWYFYMGKLCNENDKYTEALDAFAKAFDIDANPIFLEHMSFSYSELGDYVSAIDAINRAQQMRPDDSDLILFKSGILEGSGDFDGAIAELSNYIEKVPDSSGSYFQRGFLEYNTGKIDEAFDDYNMAIMLNPDYVYSYLGKGKILMLKGQTEEAMEAFRKVVELDSVPTSESCAMYALLALGEKDRAIDFMAKMIEQDPTDADILYDAACFYAQLDSLDESLDYLKKSLDLGYKRFHHIYADDDLDALRETNGFIKLMKEYQPTREASAVSQSSAEAETSRVEIPYTPENGCISVKCTINDLPLNFIFDTGASTVSLLLVEANFMLKNGYLKREDIIGSQLYADANGDISEGTVVNLRNVDFGGLTLNNVRASVVRNQKAPLLLGQSVLGRLGSIEIDNPGKKLIITNTIKSK